MSDFTQTRVFTPAGTVAHLLESWASPNTAGEEALCGRSAWPTYWHGTGSQEEEEKAADLPVCSSCSGIINFRRGGEHD